MSRLTLWPTSKFPPVTVTVVTPYAEPLTGARFVTKGVTTLMSLPCATSVASETWSLSLSESTKLASPSPSVSPSPL